jgi:restriction system protein
VGLRCEFKTKSNTKSTMIETDTMLPTDERTSREVMEDAYVTIRSGLLSELLEQIMYSSPSFFERLVVDLLVRMGYGGTGKRLSGMVTREPATTEPKKKRERTALDAR